MVQRDSTAVLQIPGHCYQGTVFWFEGSVGGFPSLSCDVRHSRPLLPLHGLMAAEPQANAELLATIIT